MPMTSRPLSTAGHEAAWMGDGLAKPAAPSSLAPTLSGAAFPFRLYDNNGDGWNGAAWTGFGQTAYLPTGSLGAAPFGLNCTVCREAGACLALSQARARVRLPRFADLGLLVVLGERGWQPRRRADNADQGTS